MKSWLSLSVFCLLFSSSILAQKLVVVNGGLFGSPTEHANIGLFDPITSSYTTLDTIFTNSVQDVLVEDNRYIYVAAQDSIVKFDLQTNMRVAAARFGSVSTVHLALANDKLLVGNWYGSSNNNLRIFDKNTLSYIDSIPEITKPASDIVIINNLAYIAQNSSSAAYQDTLGYLAVLDLSSLSWVRNDTLSTTGADLGRLVNVGDSAIYSLNKVTNTISSYNVNTQAKTTVNSTVTLEINGYGPTVFENENHWILPFNGGIGSFDLVNNTAVQSNIVNVLNTYPNQFAFTVDTTQNNIFVSQIDFTNQSLNTGKIYNFSGTQLATFQVGYSPEVLGFVYDNITTGMTTLVKQDVQNVIKAIYPNPTTDFITIQTTIQPTALTLHDIQGRLVAAQSIENPNPVVDVRNLENGAYVLTLWTANGRSIGTEVFVKQ